MFDARTIRKRDGKIMAEVSKEYAIAFNLLDLGYPIPVDLETDLMSQGYNVRHLYNLFDH